MLMLCIINKKTSAKSSLDIKDVPLEITPVLETEKCHGSQLLL